MSIRPKCLRCSVENAIIKSGYPFYSGRNEQPTATTMKKLLILILTLPPLTKTQRRNIDITVDTVDTVGKRWPGIGTGENPYNGHTVTLKGAAQTTLFGTTAIDAYLNAICVKGGYLTQTDSGAVTNCYRPEEAPLFKNKAARSATNCYTLGQLVEQVGEFVKFANCYEGI